MLERPIFNEEFFQTLPLVDKSGWEAVSSFYIYLTSTPLMSHFLFRRDVVLLFFQRPEMSSAKLN